MKFTCQRDTLKIRGKIFGIEKQPKPVIILSHGFLANMKTVEEYALLLAKKYVTVIFDFCGGGLRSKSSGKSQDMTIFTEKEDLHGDKDDIVDISYARKRHKCFPKCEYHEIKKGGHGFTGNAQKEACMLIKAFML